MRNFIYDDLSEEKKYDDGFDDTNKSLYVNVIKYTDNLMDRMLSFKESEFLNVKYRFKINVWPYK